MYSFRRPFRLFYFFLFTLPLCVGAVSRAPLYFSVLSYTSVTFAASFVFLLNELRHQPGATRSVAFSSKSDIYFVFS